MLVTFAAFSGTFHQPSEVAESFPNFWVLTLNPLKFNSLPLKRYRFTQKEMIDDSLTICFQGRAAKLQGCIPFLIWFVFVKLIDSIITSIWIQSWKKLLIRNHLIRLVVRIIWFSKLITWWFSSRPASHGCTQKQILLHWKGCEGNASIPRHSLPTTWCEHSFWWHLVGVCWVYVVWC